MAQLDPQAISISPLAMRLKGFDEHEPQVVFPAPLLIMLIQVDHSQLAILLLDQARTNASNEVAALDFSSGISAVLSGRL